MIMSPALVVIYFTFYSFFGWLHEMIFTALVERKLHLQGFLFLPLLPIYGFGALGILFATAPYADNPLMVFLSAVMVATVLELITSTFLQKAFHLQLWDYKNWPANYKGKVSLLSSLGFGLFGVLLMYVIHPFMQHVVGFIPVAQLNSVGTIFFVLIILDFIFSTRALARRKNYKFAMPHVQASVSFSTPSSVSDLHKQNVDRMKKIWQSFIK